MGKEKEQEYTHPCQESWHHASALLFKEWEHEYHLTKDHTDYALFRNDFPESEYMLEVAEYLNKVDWCPLFGELPRFGNSLPPDTQISKCCEIIENARHVLGSLPLRTDYKENGWVIKCPEPKEMPFYPEDKLLAARKLFSNWESAVMPDIEARQRQPYSKRTYLSDALYHWPDDALLDCINYSIGVDNLKAFEVLALIAIYNAWDALGDMLIFWLPENDEEVMRCVQDASFLLARAESGEAIDKINRIEKDNNKKNNKIKNLRIDAEVRRKQKRDATLASQARSYENKHKFCEKIMERIEKQIKPSSAKGMAEGICRELSLKKEEGYETIRKLIPSISRAIEIIGIKIKKTPTIKEQDLAERIDGQLKSEKKTVRPPLKTLKELIIPYVKNHATK